MVATDLQPGDIVAGLVPDGHVVRVLPFGGKTLIRALQSCYANGLPLQHHFAIWTDAGHSQGNAAFSSRTRISPDSLGSVRSTLPSTFLLADHYRLGWLAFRVLFCVDFHDFWAFLRVSFRVKV
jgi:hypothetical protein